MPSDMLRFRKLRLTNWKNFEGVEVELQDRMLLVGPNASGKSNLLDALRFLRDLSSVGGGFGEGEYGLIALTVGAQMDNEMNQSTGGDWQCEE